VIRRQWGHPGAFDADCSDRLVVLYNSGRSKTGGEAWFVIAVIVVALP
jgi:hypothetical protein